ncbi:MAG TPA: D-hexose-6-phosphate mutarotase [Candidatus Acidoferrales bacterium]|jgi:glucose-6-phosphate 1-epimerase|nr:D-hexose-6-phosphate mutarotase [Candidatus Acidoferrales bacterium]
MHEEELNNQFAIPNALRFEDTPGGLVRAAISTPAAEADIYLHGAHVTHWTPRGQRPVLFVSRRSLFAPGKAIRGGVPVIFPWFGPRGDGKPGPAHGFARTTEWAVEGAKLHPDGKVEITLALAPNDETRNLGYAAFHLRSRVTVGSELEMELETGNDAKEAFTFEEALHSYFAIADIRQASVSGLEGTTYIDKTDGFKRKTQGNAPIRIAKETDQVHVSTQAACVVHDAVWNRRIVIEKSGSDSTVVWNPWIDKTKGMSDMAADDWQQMICIETANAADNAVRLSPGATHKMTASIRIA